MPHNAINNVLIWACSLVLVASLITYIVRLARKPPRLGELSLESILSSEDTVERQLRALFVNARRMYVRDVGPALFIVGTLFVVSAVCFAATQTGNALLTQLGNAALWLIFALGVGIRFLFESWSSYRAARRIILAAG